MSQTRKNDVFWLFSNQRFPNVPSWCCKQYFSYHTVGLGIVCCLLNSLVYFIWVHLVVALSSTPRKNVLFSSLSQRILQNSFTDGVANPSDAESIKSYIVKNDGALSGYPGSTYLLSQKFEFNWMVIGSMDKVITTP